VSGANHSEKLGSNRRFRSLGPRSSACASRLPEAIAGTERVLQNDFRLSAQISEASDMDCHRSASDPVFLTRRSHGARTPGRFRRQTSAALHCPRITKFLVQLISRTDGASF
jgi:hypothetical protein